MDSGQLKIWVQKFLAQRGLTQPKDTPLYMYGTKDSEFNVLAVLLQMHGKEKDHPIYGLYWSAGFCLYVAEKFRREYDARWSWEAFENNLGIDFQPAERSRLVTNGLDFWKRPLRQRDNGQNDYLGSLFAEGGLPWSLLSNDLHGFGRAIKGGIRRYHEYRVAGYDFSLLMAEYSEYFPSVFRTNEKYHLLAQVVESLMFMAEKHQLNQQEDPAAYLNLHAPGWREAFPLPLEADNGQNLVNEWLKDAGTCLAERKLEQEKVEYFTCRHKLAGSGEFPQFLSSGVLEAEIQLAPQLEIDLNGIQINSTRIELALYEGEQIALSLGVSYAELAAEKLKIRLTNRLIRLRRQQPEQPLRLVLSSGGQLLPDKEILNSEADWQNLPAVFERQDDDLYLAGCASVKSRSPELVMRLPQKLKPDSDIAVLTEDTSGVWYRVSDPVRVSDGLSFYLIEPSSRSPLSPVFRGAQCLESTLPLSTWIGWPHGILRGDHDEYQEVPGYQVNNRKLSQLTNLNCYGCFNVEILGDTEEVLARRKLGVLPADFKLSTLPASSHAPARIIVSSSAPLNYRLADETVRYSIEEKDRETHLVIQSVTGDLPERLSLLVSDLQADSEPVVLRLPYPETGVSIIDANGARLDKNELVLNQLLGMRLWLRSALPVSETFHLVLELIGRGAPVQRVFRYTAWGDTPIEISLYSLYDEMLSLLSCSDNQDARIRLRVETSQLLRQLTVYRYAGAVQNSHSLRDTIELTDQTGQPLRHQVEGAQINAINVQNPEAEPIAVPVTKVSGIATGYFELPSALRKEGPWLLYPATESEIYFRPKIHIPDFSYCTPAEDSSFFSLQSAARYYHPVERKDIFIPVLNAMAEAFSHSSWLYLVHLKMRCQHIPLSAFESWKALARHPEALALAVLRLDMDAAFVQRFKHELAVIWEVVTVQQWQRAIQRYISGMVSKFGLSEDLLTEQLKNKLEQLAVHIPVLCSFREHLIDHASVSALPLNAVLPLWQNDLRTRHDSAIWPEALNDELMGWLAEQPAFSWINGTSLPDYMKPVIFIPVFSAHLTADKASLSQLTTDDIAIRSGISMLSDFDRHAWYEPVYSAVLTNLLQSDTP